MPRYGLKRLFLLVLLPVSLIMVMFASKKPYLVEKLFSTGFYAILSPAITSLSGLFIFSLAELFLIIGIIVLTVYTVRTIRYAVKDKDRRIYTLYTYVVNLSVLSVVFYSIFVFSCGLNYYRIPFAQTAGLIVRQSSAAELKGLCTELVNNANTQSQLVASDENGITVLPMNDQETAKEAVAAMKSMTKQYPFMRGIYSKPKPIFLSKLMSFTNITGVYFPFTFEANVNVDIPDFAIPATMCHELAHMRGFMREDEANFIAYIACRSSDNAYFSYSGTLNALSSSLIGLKKVDASGYDELYARLDDGIKRDYAFYNNYWNAYEGAVSQVSTTINNTYLKANNQSDGVYSYGRMVDLLLAEYRQRLNIL